MASSTSVSAPVQMSSSSVSSFSRNLTLDLDAVVHNVGKTKASKCDARGSALTKKVHLHRLDHLLPFHSQKSHHPKRRATVTAHHDHKLAFKRRRRINSMVLPTKFLLGGNINDPLNLRSLEDEEVNQRLNAYTPETSPIPLPRHKAQVQVLIPPNIYDPLNLNSGEEIEFNLVSPKSRKRKRHRKSKKEQQQLLKDASDHIEPLDVVPKESEEVVVATAEEPCDKEAKKPLSSPSVPDKIVSPVVPQGSPSKFYKRFHSKSFSRDDSEKLLPTTSGAPKRRRSKSKVMQNNTDITFRKTDEKFSLGNFVRHYEAIDPRLKYLSKDFFEGKEVLDIGCNIGHLTLYIAKYFRPKAMLGIDIDGRLVRIARRNTCHHWSASVCEGKKFPISMPFCYGPLVRLPMPIKKEDTERFPNNVSFLQADYVPLDEEPIDDEPVDTILCLRVTKWVHLNYSDDGLKRMFRRIYRQLRTGGQLILEPQPWSSYSKTKKLTPLTYANYQNIRLKPDKFCEFLLSEEVGFSTCEIIGHAVYSSKGHKSTLYLLTKGIPTSHEEHIQHPHHMATFSYDSVWVSSDEEYHHGNDMDHSHSNELQMANLFAAPHETEDISDPFVSEKWCVDHENNCENSVQISSSVGAPEIHPVSSFEEYPHKEDCATGSNTMPDKENLMEIDHRCSSVNVSDSECGAVVGTEATNVSEQQTSNVCAADSTQE